MIVEETKASNMYEFIESKIANIVGVFPTEIIKSEYDTETRQLTVYCTDGSVYRLQLVQIN